MLSGQVRLIDTIVIINTSIDCVRINTTIFVNASIVSKYQYES